MIRRPAGSTKSRSGGAGSTIRPVAGPSTTPRYDVAVVGAGLVGLATAFRLLERRPGLGVVVIDKEHRVAAHQSSHNSGVIHAGVYYTPGSLKARLCLEGRVALERFAEGHGIPVERCGKVIVALDDSELGRLAALRERAVGNGVPGVREMGPAELAEIEPHVMGVRALHVPSTSIVDFERVALAYAEEVKARGGALLLGRRVDGLRPDGTAGVVLLTSGGEVRARRVVTCAGLHADRLAGEADGAGVRIVPFRGDYYTLAPAARALVRGLVYPVPDPSLPFLGVHFTRRIDGEVWAGPNAVLAFAREGYGRLTVDVAELAATLRYRGFWRLARRYWRTGCLEMWRDVAKSAFLKELRRYVPELSSSDLTFGPSGVRAQAVAADGAMVEDFAIDESEHAIHVRNAPSPGATASLAIGGHLAALAMERFQLG